MMVDIINRVKRSRFSPLTLILIDILNSDNNVELSGGVINITDNDKIYVFFSTTDKSIIIYDFYIHSYYRHLYEYKPDDIVTAIKNSRWSEYEII